MALQQLLKHMLCVTRAKLFATQSSTSIRAYTISNYQCEELVPLSLEDSDPQGMVVFSH